MANYAITAGKTEVAIAYSDSKYNILGTYKKVLDVNYAKGATFSIDLPGVPTPQLPSAYAISVSIIDLPYDPSNPDIHACIYRRFN